MESQGRTLEENEMVIADGLHAYVDVGQSLWEIKEEEQYKGKYGSGFTWEKYCKERWNMSASIANKYIKASETYQRIEEENENRTNGPLLPLPTSERVTRPLTRLDAKEQVAVWEEIVKKCGDKPTAKEVQQAVDYKLPVSPKKKFRNIQTSDASTKLPENRLRTEEDEVNALTTVMLTAEALQTVDIEELVKMIPQIWNFVTLNRSPQHKKQIAKAMIDGLYGLYPDLREEPKTETNKPFFANPKARQKKSPPTTTGKK